jgi:hypothetical protein
LEVSFFPFLDTERLFLLLVGVLLGEADLLLFVVLVCHLVIIDLTHIRNNICFNGLLLDLNAQSSHQLVDKTIVLAVKTEDLALASVILKLSLTCCQTSLSEHNPIQHSK